MSTGLLERTVGGDALAVTLGADALPLGQVGPVTIRHGRTSPDQQPEAATCTLTVNSSALPVLPRIGDALVVSCGPAVPTWLGGSPAELTRFTGRVTDVLAVPSSGVLGPSVVTVVGVSKRARLGPSIVGSDSWPEDYDGARAGRILTAADVAPYTADGGSVVVLARPSAPASALELLDALAVDTGGVLAERRDGQLQWHDADHRQATVPAVTLDASDVLAPTSATQTLAGLVNDLTVEYGGAGATVRITDADSVVTFGPFAAQARTQLASEVAATEYANGIVGRRGRPRWSTPALTVDLLRSVDPATALDLLNLEFADLVGVTGFPASGPFADAQLWLEGWTETVTRSSWRLALDVSAYRLTGPRLRWSDVAPGVAWTDVPVGRSWLESQWSLIDDEL